MQSQQISDYFALPDQYGETGTARQKDRVITMETDRYKTVNFWFSVLEKYGYSVFDLVATNKVGKYGIFYDFIARIPESEQPIHVDISGKNFIMSRVSVKKGQEDKSTEASFLMYKTKQTSQSSTKLFDLMHIMSCIQFSLFHKIMPDSQNQLVFSYSPISTKATNIALKPRKEPFIKFNMTIDKPQVVSAKGTFDMNTIFVAYEEKKLAKKKGLVPCGSEFVPVPKTMTTTALQKEITEQSIAMNACIDMSNIHVPTSRVGYVSFKALVRNLVYFRNPRPPQINVTIDSKSDMYNDLMMMAHGDSDDDTDDDEYEAMVTDNGISKRVRAFPSEYEMTQSVLPSLE